MSTLRLQPDMTHCSSTLKEPPRAQRLDLAKPRSCSKRVGDLYLNIQSRFNHVFHASEMVQSDVAIQTYTFATKFADAGCDWPDKPEIVITVTLTPCPNYQNHVPCEKLQHKRSDFNRFTLRIKAGNVPSDYQLEMKGCELRSIDQYYYPIFCENVAGFCSESLSAVLHLCPDSKFRMSLELRLLALKPHANILEATQTLADRLLSSADKTGDVMLKTQVSLSCRCSRVALISV